jgi:iron complex transport system ATP-binding protein
VLTAERLTAAYGIRVDVHVDPSTGHVRTRAVARHHSRTLTPQEIP